MTFHGRMRMIIIICWLIVIACLLFVYCRAAGQSTDFSHVKKDGVEMLQPNFPLILPSGGGGSSSLPASPGFTTSANGQLGQDTTTGQWHLFGGSGEGDEGVLGFFPNQPTAGNIPLWNQDANGQFWMGDSGFQFPLPPTAITFAGSSGFIATSGSPINVDSAKKNWHVFGGDGGTAGAQGDEIVATFRTTSGGTNVPSPTDGHCAAWHQGTSGQVALTDSGSFCPTFGILSTGICSTAATAYSTCTSTVTLNQTLPNTNYAVSCSGVAPTGFPAIMAVSKFTSTVVVTIVNGGSNGAVVSTYGEIDCVVAR